MVPEASGYILNTKTLKYHIAEPWTGHRVKVPGVGDEWGAVCNGALGEPEDLVVSLDMPPAEYNKCIRFGCK